MSQQHSAWQPSQSAHFQTSLATELLSERPSRTADYEAENHALRMLARQMAEPPGALLQRLVDLALDLGSADTAGVSLLESGPGGATFFRRVALAGANAHHVDTTTPADSSGCGYALHRNAAQLYTYVDGYQAYGGVHFPDVVEKLVIPFPAHGDPYGAIWIATHDTARRFDAEDARILQSLADFTAAALRLSLTAKENARLTEQIEADLQGHRRADEARRQSEAKFRRLSESGLVSVAYFDASGRLTGANDAFLRMIDYSREELITGALHWQRLTPEDWAACMRAVLDEFARTGKMQPHERQYFRRDGTRFWALVGAARLEGSQEGVAFVLDIDERKQAEQEAQQQHERLRVLWETAAAALATNDPPAMLQTLMQRIGPQLGIDAYCNHLLSESGDGLRLESHAGVPEDAAHELRWLAFDNATGGSTASNPPPIAEALDKAQQIQLARIESQAYACYPLLADKNRLLGTLSFFGRARPQFRADELEFLDTIGRYVSIAYERLRLITELRVSDRRKDEFLATLAHELRNPLAPIRNGLQLIGAPALNTEALARVRAMMDRQLAQMVRLIDDLLDVSRITRGKIDLRKQRVELATVLMSASETVRPLIESRGHELRITLPQQPIPLDADLTRLSQVFMNLLNNAAKYTESGGRIDIEAALQNDDVIVGVRDNGIGISAEVLPNVFELFVQGDRSLERAQGGLGIGLTLVKRLVEMHGGSIQAKSEGPGHGAEFLVRLPLAPTHPSDEQPEPMQTAVQTSRPDRRRILVADDNRDAAESLATLFGIDGDEVRIAHDGAEAVELEERFVPDVVVLDIGMPFLNGYEAARRIRARGSKALLIALTGWGQDNDKRSSREAGFDFHLVKPVEPETLRTLVRQADSVDRPESTSTP